MDDTNEGDFYKVATLTPSASTRTATAQLVGAGTDGDDANAERIDGCEVAMPSGLASVPALTQTTEAYAVRRGDEAVVLVIIDKGAPPQVAESGETRLYGVGQSNNASVVRIRANGDIEITAGATANIVLNGGTLDVARKTDAIAAGNLVFIPGTGGAQLFYNGAPVGGTPTSITGTVTSGNARVKA